METYAVVDNNVLFAKPGKRPHCDVITMRLSKETVLKCAEEIKQNEPCLKQHNYSSDEIYQKIIQAEKKLRNEKEKKEWYLRGCRVGICPKCGAKIKRHIPNGSPLIEYRCTACPFCKVFKT